jgi:hypothetical protein
MLSLSLQHSQSISIGLAGIGMKEEKAPTL